MGTNPSKDVMRQPLPQGGDQSSVQSLSNQSFDPVFRTFLFQLAGSPDGTNMYTAKVGADGLLQSSPTTYKTLYDFAADGTYIYTGEAVPGTSSAGSTWRIVKTVFDASGNPTGKLWANGSSSFDKTWTDRATYSYTA